MGTIRQVIGLMSFMSPQRHGLHAAPQQCLWQTSWAAPLESEHSSGANSLRCTPSLPCLPPVQAHAQAPSMEASQRKLALVPSGSRRRELAIW